MTATSVIDIDLTRLDENIATIRRAVGPKVAICAVVKADAYGLGAVRVARRMQALGVEMLAVYTAEQARELVKAGITADLLIMMPIRDIERTDLLYRSLISGKLHLVVHDLGHLEDLIQIGDRFGCELPLHLEVDLGMSRGGCGPDEAREILDRMSKSRRMALAGLMTHFPNAESDAAGSKALLDEFRRLIESQGHGIARNCYLHAANSAALVRGAEFHLNMVRIGLAWTGFVAAEVGEAVGGKNARKDGHPAATLSRNLRGLVRWTSHLTHVKWVEPGATVGYGAAWTATRRTRIGLTPVGYADGYPIALSNRGVTRVGIGDHWHEAPVIGRVSMDQLTIDLTDAPPPLTRLGTEVELISNDDAAPNSLLRLASQADVIPYVLLCGLNSRIPRVYRTGAGAGLGGGPGLIAEDRGEPLIRRRA